ncbi:hypothetical protein LEMLEM_LOCUS14699 [Lemmus lemmus]
MDLRAGPQSKTALLSRTSYVCMKASRLIFKVQFSA